MTDKEDMLTKQCASMACMIGRISVYFDIVSAFAQRNGLTSMEHNQILSMNSEIHEYIEKEFYNNLS